MTTASTAVQLRRALDLLDAAAMALDAAAHVVEQHAGVTAAKSIRTTLAHLTLDRGGIALPESLSESHE